ncbi:MAG: hypothetical protein ACOVQ4_07410 [Flectobacillus sp.]|uniref:hypothetical protein n=1 Tax=Flectobacillus sp. TaxID=50419 RepID=UPI003B9D84A4
MLKSLTIFLTCYMLALFFPTFAQFGTKWGDQGNGTFQNPVLPSDFSDLDAIRVGDDFYARLNEVGISTQPSSKLLR